MSPCYQCFLTVTQNYHSKVTPIDALHAKKIAKEVLLCVFKIAFPKSLLIYKSTEKFGFYLPKSLKNLFAGMEFFNIKPPILDHHNLKEFLNYIVGVKLKVM